MDPPQTMELDIAALKQAGADGIVLGILNPDGSVDAETTQRLAAAAAPCVRSAEGPPAMTPKWLSRDPWSCRPPRPQAARDVPSRNRYALSTPVYAPGTSPVNAEHAPPRLASPRRVQTCVRMPWPGTRRRALRGQRAC
jgi:hypothetical protein